MRRAKQNEAIARERQQMAQSLGLSASDRGADGIDWLAYTLPGRVGGVLLTPRDNWRMPRNDVRHPQSTGNDWLDAVFSTEARNPLSAAVLNDAGFAYAASQLPYPSSIELTEGQLVCAHWLLTVAEQGAYLQAAVLLAEAIPAKAIRSD